MRDHDLGWVYEPGRPLPGLTTTTVADRRRMQDFALRRFTKQAYAGEYARALDALS